MPPLPDPLDQTVPADDGALPSSGKAAARVSGDHDLSTAETALDRETMPSQASPGSSSVRSFPASVASGGVASRRSTVLPRVEVVGAEPRLVHDARDRYEQLGKLGEGGVGEVLKVRDNDIGRTVAVKRLLPDLQGPATLARFADEVRTIGTLEHPHIVPVHDVGVDERGEYYFVMKYVDGETLESVIAKLAAGDAQAHARYPFERRMDIFEEILEALAYAHGHGVVHRDIKPANVMIGRYGEVMVMDWGIARRDRTVDVPPPDPRERPTAPPIEGDRAEVFRTREGALIGTPAYMSPEQARGEPVDARSDVYSASVLLYELLSLKHPHGDKQTLAAMLEAVQREPAAALITWKHPHQAVVPADLAWYVQKGLAKSPADRYPSVDAMLDRLHRRREGWIPIQCQVTFTLRVANAIRAFLIRHPLVLTVGLLGVVVGLGVLGVLGVRALR